MWAEILGDLQREGLLECTETFLHVFMDDVVLIASVPGLSEASSDRADRLVAELRSLSTSDQDVRAVSSTNGYRKLEMGV